MGNEHGCDCGDLEEGHEGGASNWIRWLDARNEMRAAWIALSGANKIAEREGLASSIHELQQSSLEADKLDSSPFIRTKDDLVAWAGDAKALRSSPLDRLSSADREKFFNLAKFEDYTEKGQRYRHVGTFFTGDLTQKYGFSYGELFEVFAMFGIGPELAVKAHHKFGWDVDNARCQPRMHFNCPWSRNC